MTLTKKSLSGYNGLFEKNIIVSVGKYILKKKNLGMVKPTFF